MMDHFNGEIENLGNSLFDDGANPEDFKQFAEGFAENE